MLFGCPTPLPFPPSRRHHWATGSGTRRRRGRSSSRVRGTRMADYATKQVLHGVLSAIVWNSPPHRASVAVEPELLQERSRVRQQDAVLVMKGDRKSTRLNSSHVRISYAVF